jgi:hypothetical protein
MTNIGGNATREAVLMSVIGLQLIENCTASQLPARQELAQMTYRSLRTF